MFSLYLMHVRVKKKRGFLLHRNMKQEVQGPPDARIPTYSKPHANISHPSVCLFTLPNVQSTPGLGAAAAAGVLLVLESHAKQTRSPLHSRILPITPDHPGVVDSFVRLLEKAMELEDKLFSFTRENFSQPLYCHVPWVCGRGRNTPLIA